MTDSVSYSRRLIHRLGFDVRPTYIFPTNSFPERREYGNGTHPAVCLRIHLKYSFQYYPNSYTDRIYRGSYQGIGLSGYSFQNKEELGNPIAVYVFQEPASNDSIRVCHSIMNGTSAHLSAGNLSMKLKKPVQ